MPKVKVTVEGKIFKFTWQEHNLHIYQNIKKKKTFAHLLFLTSTSAMRKVCFNTPEVKVTVEGHMFKFICLEHNFYIYQWISKQTSHTCCP